MSDIGDVPHQEDIVAVILEHTAQPVRRYERTEVANMDIAVDSGSAAVNAHTRRVERCKQVFASGQRIIQVNRFCRNRCHEHSSSNVISWYGTMSLPGVWESSHIFLFQTTRIGAPFSANRVSGGSSSDRGRAGEVYFSTGIFSSNARQYVHRGLSHPKFLCERQDRRSIAFLSYGASRSIFSNNAQACLQHLLHLVYHRMRLWHSAFVGEQFIES